MSPLASPSYFVSGIKRVYGYGADTEVVLKADADECHYNVVGFQIRKVRRPKLISIHNDVITISYTLPH
jgi:hypothetical protein